MKKICTRINDTGTDFLIQENQFIRSLGSEPASDSC
jgi:hypothetical protein